MSEPAWGVCSTAELIAAGVLEIGDGYRAKGSEFVPGGGLPFVRVGDVHETIETEGLDELPLELRDRYEPKVSRPGDCLITMKGTVGRVAHVPPEMRPFVYSPQISYWRVRDRRRIVPAFLRCWLRGAEFEQQALATKRSTDMADYVNLRDQRRMRISLPPLPVQRRIASVLAAFDELIGINRRRVELLEALALSLYREWFVRFRFPGRDGAEMVDSEVGPVPRDWPLRPLGSLLELEYGKALPARVRRPGEFAVVSSAGIIDTHDEALVPGPGVVLGRKGNVGSVWWVERPFFPIDTTYYVRSDVPLEFLYWRLREASFVNSHAAVPGLSRDQAYAMEIMLPPEGLLHEFSERCGVLFKRAAICQETIERLTAARDLLLPRLVSGRIDVTGVDLGALTPREEDEE